MLPSWNYNGRPVSFPLPGRGSLPARIGYLTLLITSLYFLAARLGGSSFSLLPSGRSTSLGTFTSSSYRTDKSLFLDPPPLARPGYLPEPVPPKKLGMRVPNSVHYVYGLKPLDDGAEGEEFPYYAYLAMRSALLNIQPAVTYFHYEHLPTGPWWELISRNLTLVKTEIPIAVYGRRLSHFAHKADVLRLLTMKHSGGIYLDVDMFITKSFDDLMYYSTTLGMEASPDSRRTPLDPEGLCNAVIISEPHSPFIDRWLGAYDTFDEGNWAGHSVVLPWALARRYPDEVQVLNSRAFFWPMWHGEEIQYTHERDDYDFYATGQYAYHAWETLAMGYLSKLSPSSIREHDNSFNRLVRPFIGPEDDAVFAHWRPREHR